MGMSLRCVGSVKRSVIVKANEFVKAMGLNAVKQFLENDNIRTKEMSDDLKRIVESHELVQCYGGYDLAKNVMQITPLRKSSYDLIEKLKQAIADVESCQ